MGEPPDPNEDLKTLNVQLANQIINIANKKLEDGMPVEAIATGIRHAAANFSAFAHHGSGSDDKGIQNIVEDFLQMFEYYLERHAPTQTTSKSENSLKALIDQAKNEV